MAADTIRFHICMQQEKVFNPSNTYGVGGNGGNNLGFLSSVLNAGRACDTTCLRSFLWITPSRGSSCTKSEAQHPAPLAHAASTPARMPANFQGDSSLSLKIVHRVCAAQVHHRFTMPPHAAATPSSLPSSTLLRQASGWWCNVAPQRLPHKERCRS